MKLFTGQLILPKLSISNFIRIISPRSRSGYKLNGTKLFTYPSITITMLKVFPNNKNPTTSHRNYFSPSYQGNNTGSDPINFKNSTLGKKFDIYIYIYVYICIRYNFSLPKSTTRLPLTDTTSNS